MPPIYVKPENALKVGFEMAWNVKGGQVADGRW
jgi:hypothetical protein